MPAIFIVTAFLDQNVTPADSEIVTGISVEDHAQGIQLGSRLKFPAERVYKNVERYGNTSAASIPIALDECVREGRLEVGDMEANGILGVDVDAVADSLFRPVGVAAVHRGQVAHPRDRVVEDLGPEVTCEVGASGVDRVGGTNIGAGRHGGDGGRAVAGGRSRWQPAHDHPVGRRRDASGPQPICRGEGEQHGPGRPAGLEEEVTEDLPGRPLPRRVRPFHVGLHAVELGA